MPRKNLPDLIRLVTEAESADRTIFAEMRSNILLKAGEHYTKRNYAYWNRIRLSNNVTQEQKLRLTKNHIQKIVNTYVNQITTHAPGVAVLPNNEKEMQDQKAAELNQSVWQYAKQKHRLKEKRREWAEDFVTIGECAVKITWDESKGALIGYQQAVDEMTGEPLFEQGPPDPMTGEPTRGEPRQDPKKPVFSGDFVFKRVFPFNLRRPPGCQNLAEAPWICEVDLVPIKEVKDWVKDDPDKMNKIVEDNNQQFHVFDGNLQGYAFKKGYTQVYSMFWRPSSDYPNGFFHIFTRTIKLFEGELPFGIFPIRWAGFDPIQTSPRARSIIKQLRPYQVEINRCASKIAEHQVTLGDDKLLIQSGTKITQGVNYPGVRSMQYTGKEPIVLAGRSGAQYLDYMSQQISEMYEVANVYEETQEKNIQGQDAWGQLFKSARQKKKFSLYDEKFEQFMVDVAELYLMQARHYLDPNHLIPMIGKNEAVNIPEFKSTEPFQYQVKIEARSEDVESQFGKQLAINMALQYTGKKLEKESIGKLMRAMPFGNFEEGFEDFTMEYDSVTNLMLALDRGEQPEPSPYDKPTYVVQRLVNRIRLPEFKQLDPQIQQKYMMYKQLYEQMEVEQQRKILAAQADFIPTGGPKIKVDFYVPKAGSPDKSERATLPAESVNWLVERLADQGSSQDRLGDLNQGAAAEMAAMMKPQIPYQAPGQGQGGGRQ